MSSKTVIEIANLNKIYPIFKRPEDRLKQMIWRKRRKYYEEFWALHDINLKVEQGETLGIIGRNGSGKSTLLHLICGTHRPTSGSVTVTGRVAALLELGAGFNPEFTGRENVFLAASVLGLSNTEIEKRFPEIEAFAGIGDFINQPVKLYSSGMYARLAFAVAAHVDADILIIDEILSVGDAAFGQKCMRFIRSFKERGTILFVSHDTNAVVNLCDRALWLDSGKVRDYGIAKDVCHNYIASLTSELDNVNAFKIGGSRQAPPEAGEVFQDHRHELLQNSSLRNEIELFNFNPDAPWFGSRGATIEKVSLEDPSGNLTPLLKGGEQVVLRIACRAENDIKKPIIGFYIKDRLGQYLFGDNTYLTFQDQSVPVEAGSQFYATFQFQLPYLPTGDYSVIAAIAEGTQADHVQHHWIDDALFFRVHSSHVSKGLMGIAMLQIDLRTGEASQPIAQAI